MVMKINMTTRPVKKTFEEARFRDCFLENVLMAAMNRRR
jgi:hypothetical protein